MLPEGRGWGLEAVCKEGICGAGCGLIIGVILFSIRSTKMQKQTHRSGEETCGCQGEAGRRWDGFGVGG